MSLDGEQCLEGLKFSLRKKQGGITSKGQIKKPW
jgi:hypothetical protein